MGDGRFLGMIEELELREYSVTLCPGDCLLLYSDGVTDGMNTLDERYDLERLKQTLSAARREAASNILDYLIKDILRWRGDAPAFDDVTMVLIEALTPLDGDIQ
jgi:sigma-B regulation protein RsbU (phosphoserine phosphatase)